MEITQHNVGTLRVETKQSGDSQWLQLTVYDWQGKQVSEITLFAYEGKNITLELGGE